MTITTGVPPTHDTPVALARGFLTGGVIGTSLAALVVGAVIENVPLFVTGLGLPAVYGLLFFLAGRPRRAREAAVVLDKGELRRAIDSLTKGKDTRPALTFVVQERLLSVVFAPTDTQASQFDPRSLPYERFPALVEEATTTLGIGSPQTWQLTADRLTGSLTIRVGVTGPEGTASLEAGGEGKVMRRTPAR